MPVLQSRSIFHLLNTPNLFSNYTDFRHWNFHSTCAPISQLTLDPLTFEWQCFFTYTLGYFLKTKEEPGLHHVSCLFYFYLNEYKCAGSVFLHSSYSFQTPLSAEYYMPWSLG